MIAAALAVQQQDHPPQPNQSTADLAFETASSVTASSIDPETGEDLLAELDEGVDEATRNQQPSGSNEPQQPSEPNVPRQYGRFSLDRQLQNLLSTVEAEQVLGSIQTQHHPRQPR